MDNCINAIYKYTYDKSQDDINTNIHRNAEDRLWLMNLPKPWWLLNNIYDDMWEVKDASQGKSVKIYWNYIYGDSDGNVYCLTDPENSHLLKTIQIICYQIRDGQFATCDSSETQKYTTLGLFLIVGWMRLNNVFRFDQLTTLEFEKYTEDAVFGKSRLLDAPRRLERYLENIRTGRAILPTKYLKKDKVKVLDFDAIGNQLGINLHQGCVFPIISYRLALIAQNENLYLTPSQRQRTQRAEPTETVKDDMTITGLIMPWKRLWDFRTMLEDCLLFDPFEDKNIQYVVKNAIRHAGDDCEDTHTGTIPEYQAAFLIDCAIRWVINYSDDLLSLCAENEKIYQLVENEKQSLCLARRQSIISQRMSSYLDSYVPTGFTPNDTNFPAQPWPIVAHYKLPPGDSRLTLHKAVNNYLPVACLIVICAFTANRHEAVFEIYDNNPRNGDHRKPAIESDEEGDWLICWIGKSVRDWDRKPCPRIVKKAVEVLHNLSESARSLTGNRKLFQFKKIGSNDVHDLTNIRELLKDFVRFVNVPPLDDGTYWDFTPRQFRKFFAILYMFGYEHGNLSALSKQMSHFDLKITEDYCLKNSNDTTLSKMKKNHTAELIVDVAIGKRKPVGKGGEILAEMLGKLVKQAVKEVKIVSVNCSLEAARRIAERVMQKLELTMVPFQWGYCAAFSKLDHENFSGNCVENGKQICGPNLTKATPKNCSDCSHFYTDQNFKYWWIAMASLYAGHLNNPNLPVAFYSYTKDLAEMFTRIVTEFFADIESD